MSLKYSKKFINNEKNHCNDREQLQHQGYKYKITACQSSDSTAGIQLDEDNAQAYVQCFILKEKVI